MSLPVAIRNAGEGDLGLILNSWLKSYRNSAATQVCTNDIYYSEEVGQKARILELMAKGQTIVACDPSDPDIVYGWLCIGRVSPPVAHYVYVKQAYRRQGVANALLEHVGMDAVEVWITHITRALYDAGVVLFKYVPHWRP